ncbi:MAG: YccF domain-containing protein [Caulobacterales bacterium]
MALILNILWFILGGFVSGLAWLFAGVLLAITIVGLPWSAAAFRIGLFSFAPFGRQVVPRQSWNGRGDLGTGPLGFLLNVVWVLLAGWWLALHHVILGIALMVTIIGIPFGIQHFKLALISFAPVGQTVVEG